MIIAWPLADITSMRKGKHTYEKKGKVVKVISMHDNMVVLENRKGERFPANKEKVIWHKT